MDEQALRRVADAMMMQAPPPPTWSPGVAMVGGAMTPQAYNGEGGAPMGPDDPLNRPGFAQGMMQHYATPGAAMQPNPYPPGSEEAVWYDQNRSDAMAQWGPQQAFNMVGAGMPMAQAGALGAGGGRLRNQFTGAFRKEGETPLPGNPYRSVNTQAQPVAANSAAVVDRMQAPAMAADPALLEANLARMNNPMVQQTAPAPVAPAGPSWMDALQSASGWR